MEPSIHANHGFIDKYIGDAIMALFAEGADDALRAAIGMLTSLSEYNSQRLDEGRSPIDIGIGINTGQLMLGTIGGEGRMEGTVISDTVNAASRVESLTKKYGASILITDATFHQLKHPLDYSIRLVDRVQVKGKNEPITLFEVMDGERAERLNAKRETASMFNEGLAHYYSGEFVVARNLFQSCLEVDSHDKVCQLFLERAERYSESGVNSDWAGVVQLDEK